MYVKHIFRLRLHKSNFVLCRHKIIKSNFVIFFRLYFALLSCLPNSYSAAKS